MGLEFVGSNVIRIFHISKLWKGEERTYERIVSENFFFFSNERWVGFYILIFVYLQF